MKKQELSFLGQDVFDKQNSIPAASKNKFKHFDWVKAAEIIKEHLINNPYLTAEAGLQGDWDYTGGVIFENGKPTNSHYTFLSSNWATPTLLIDGEEIDCYTTVDGVFNSDSKWDENSLSVLGIQL